MHSTFGLIDLNHDALEEFGSVEPLLEQQREFFLTLVEDEREDGRESIEESDLFDSDSCTWLEDYFGIVRAWDRRELTSEDLIPAHSVLRAIATELRTMEKSFAETLRRNPRFKTVLRQFQNLDGICFGLWVSAAERDPLEVTREERYFEQQNLFFKTPEHLASEKARRGTEAYKKSQKRASERYEAEAATKVKRQAWREANKEERARKAREKRAESKR